MSAKQPSRRVDRSGVQPATIDVEAVAEPTPTRHDEYVREQFLHEVRETVELIRSTSISAQVTDIDAVRDIHETCVDNLAELGAALGLDGFLVAVTSLTEAIRFDPFDGAQLDRRLDEVLRASWDWPS